MIERFGHAKIRMLACPICGLDLRDSIPAVHIARDHEPSDIGLTALQGGDQQ